MTRTSSKIPAKYAKGPVYADVKGAPFRIGEVVRIHKIVDDAGDRTFLGKTGIVEHYEYSCGCGQSYPSDPMLGVRLPDGRLDAFWKEELRVVKTSVGGAASIGVKHRPSFRKRTRVVARSWQEPNP